MVFRSERVHSARASSVSSQPGTSGCSSIAATTPSGRPATSSRSVSSSTRCSRASGRSAVRTGKAPNVRDTASPELTQRLTARGRVKLAKMRETMSVFAIELNQPRRASATTPVLAVLPFEPGSRERAMRTLSDGVSEEILYAVSRNWENLPDAVEVGPHSDLDLIVHPSHLGKVEELWHATKTNPQTNPAQRRVPVIGPDGGESFLLVDLRARGEI